MLQEQRDQVLGSLGQHTLGLFGGGFVLGVIVRLVAALVVPVGNFVDFAVVRCPFLDAREQVGGDLVDRDGGFAAMQAEQSEFANLPREEGEEGGLTAVGWAVSDGHVDEALVPDAAFVGRLCGEAVGADERMGHAPDLAVKLAKGLGTPAGQREVVEVAKGPAILFPESVE